MLCLQGIATALKYRIASFAMSGRYLRTFSISPVDAFPSPSNVLLCSVWKHRMQMTAVHHRHLKSSWNCGFSVFLHDFLRLILAVSLILYQAEAVMGKESILSLSPAWTIAWETCSGRRIFGCSQVSNVNRLLFWASAWMYDWCRYKTINCD